MRISYIVNSHPLLLLQLSNSKVRSSALQALVNISANRQILLAYLSSSAIVKFLVSAYRSSLKKSSAFAEDEELITTLWSFIAGDLRLASKALESCPDLVDQFWTIIEKDKDKHARRYITIFSVFKQLSGLPGGSALLPQVVATFERSVRKLGPDSNELLVQIIPLMTYFDPKYTQYYASHTNTIEILGRAFKTAFDLKLPPLVFDQLFALVRFLGLKYAPLMKEVGVFDIISELTRNKEQARIQIAAIQLSELFGTDLHEDSVESLVESLRSAEAPLERVKALNELEKIFDRSLVPSAVRSDFAAALISSTASSIKDLVNRSFLLLTSLELSTEECIKLGLVRLYHSLLIKAISAPFLTYIEHLNCAFEILLDAIKRTGQETTTVKLTALPRPSGNSIRPSSVAKGFVSPLLLAEVAEIGLFETLLSATSSPQWDYWLVHHISFWTCAHHGLPSLAPSAVEFYNTLSKKLAELSGFSWEGPYLLDIAYVICLREVHTQAQNLATSPSAEESVRMLKHIGRTARRCLKHVRTNSTVLPMPLRLNSSYYKPHLEQTLDARIKELLGLTNSADADSASHDNLLLTSFTAQYSYGLNTAIQHLMQPSATLAEMTDLLCCILYSEALSHVDIDPALFVDAVFVLMHSFYSEEACYALIGEIISKAPSLRTPLTITGAPIFPLLEGAVLFISPLHHWDTLLALMLTRREIELFILFESAVVMQAIKAEPLCPFTAPSSHSRTWVIRGTDRPLTMASSAESHSAIFARHGDVLGYLMNAWPMDFYQGLTDEQALVCDTPWWCERPVIDYLLSSPDIVTPGLLLLRIEVLKYTERVRARVAERKAEQESNQNGNAADSSSAPGAPMSPFEEALGHALSNPFAILGSLTSVLRELYTSDAAPSIALLNSLAELCRMWRVPSNDADAKASESESKDPQPRSPYEIVQSDLYWFYPERLNLLFFVLRVLDYVHCYDEFYAIFRSGTADYTPLYDPLFNLAADYFLPRALFIRRAQTTKSALPWRLAYNTWPHLDRATSLVFGDEAFNIRHAYALDHYGTADRASEMPPFDREQRLELIRLLMGIAIDVLDTIPKDHIAPLCSPTTRTQEDYEPEPGSPDPTNPTIEEVTQFARLQAFLLVFAAETFGSLATYPAPSISRSAMRWLSTRFWKDLTTYSDYQSLELHFRYGLHSAANASEFACFVACLGRPELWIPENFGHWLFTHFHDPETLALTLRGLSRLWDTPTYAARLPLYQFGLRSSIQYDVTDKMPHIIQTLLMHYLHLFEDLINNPVEWEQKHILSVTPEPVVTKTEFSTLSKLPEPSMGHLTAFHLSRTKGYKLPQRPASDDSPSTAVQDPEGSGAVDGVYESDYNKTLEWTDWDELEWFTRPPLPSEPTLRIHPLDSYGAYNRQPTYMKLDQKWDSHHPFPTILDPKSIPKDGATRRSSINERLPTYISAIGDVILATMELLAVDAKTLRTTPDFKDGHPQLPWSHDRIIPTENSVEAAYVLLSHIFCRTEVANRYDHYSGIITSSTGSSSFSTLPYAETFRPNVRHDLEEALLNIPEMRDFAWKLLAIRETPWGASPAVTALNELALQKLVELELEKPSAGDTSRLSSTHPLWSSAVSPALGLYGSVATQRLPPTLKQQSREAMLTAANCVIKEILHDAAACLNIVLNVELTQYGEFVDFFIAYLRPEDHAHLPRITEERVFGGAPASSPEDWHNKAAHSISTGAYRKDIYLRLKQRLRLLLELTRGLTDFPWDDLLHTPAPIPTLTENERSAGRKLFQSVAPRPAAYYNGQPEADVSLTDAERGSFPLPREFRTSDDDYMVPDYKTATTLNFRAKSSAAALSNWRHVIEAPSVLRLVAACELSYYKSNPLPTLEHDCQTAFAASSQALFVQAVSTPLRALRFVTDPYYVYYLHVLTTVETLGPLEMRLGCLITRTGLFESAALLNHDGAPLAPKDDIIDEKHGNIVLGRKNKKSIRKGRYLSTIRNAMANGFYKPASLSAACAVPAYATLMTHDPWSWNIAPSGRSMMTACGVLWAIHLDLCPSTSYVADTKYAIGRFHTHDEQIASMWALRWRLFTQQNSRSLLPQEILLPSGDDISFDDTGATKSQPISQATSSSDSGMVRNASLGSFMNFVDSADSNGWKLPDCLPPLKEMRPISHLPTLYAVPPSVSQSSKEKPHPPAGGQYTLWPTDLLTPPTFIMMAHYGMLKESDVETQDVTWLMKKVSALGAAGRVMNIQELRLQKFTTNTKPYFLSNGITGASFITPQTYAALDTTEPLDNFIYDSATEPGKISKVLIYWAVPHNRIVNVWFPQFTRSFGASTVDAASSLTRFRLSRVQEREWMAFRLGFATASALEKLNAHPLLAVGDVPGSFAFSFQETGAFEQGKYLPLVGANGWWRMKGSASHRRDFFVDVDTRFKTICYHGDVYSEGEQYNFCYSTILPDGFDTSEELFPVMSFYSVCSFHFDVFRGWCESSPPRPSLLTSKASSNDV